MLEIIEHCDDSTSPEDVPEAATGEVERSQRLCRLFRHSLTAGQVHPLVHVMLRHGDVQGGLQVPRGTSAHGTLPLAASARIDPGVLRQRIVQLPSLPQAVLDVMRILGDDDASTSDIADRIERDQALTARTLRIANSAFYGVPGRIGTIRNAIGILGLRTVGTLLTTAAVSARFASAKCPEFQFGMFWRHAIATALMITTNWFSFIQLPNTLTKVASAGLFTRPSGLKISFLDAVKRIFVTAGTATHRPTVETRRTVGVAWVKRRNSAKYSASPSKGA